MRRLRLAGFFLFAIGSAVLIYLGIEFFALKAPYDSATAGLELLGFVLGLSGAWLIQTQKKRKM